MNILILGASGLVGKALVKELRDNYSVYGTYNQKNDNYDVNKMFQLSVDDANGLSRLLQQINPDIVISCLRGDFERQLEFHRQLAVALSGKNNARLLFCSTANVFDGSTDRPHYESDVLKSVSNYGQYKIKCEKLITEILKDKAVILRLPMLWGKNSPRYNELVGQLNRKETISSCDDFYMNTNTDVHLAKQIRYIIENDLKGIFHLATSDAINYREFIEELILKSGYQLPDFTMESLSEGGSCLTAQPSISKAGYYLAVLPSRSDIPQALTITNREVIEHLLSIGP